ncbi:serine hydrolase domain-containing protein [Maribacter sp. 2307UL18-2]|uniref:serine hydrolase domain-containing protein n=1 Tax=Maribacter sp. 2307UL18-2 TaxID=3386274 RepID=UPI0039BD238A
MHKLSPPYLFLIVVFSCNLSISQDIESKVDASYEVKQNEPGFSIAVFKKDDVILEKQYGIANMGYGIPVTKETIFDIGSIGKQFTAAAILLLEEEGKLSIKEPVNKYIENFPNYPKGTPTIEHLLNQTSGIKEVDPYLGVLDLHAHDYISQSQLINITTKVNELLFEPGEYFYYANINYILLAVIIEKVSGNSYNNYLNENIFQPLGMTRTIVDNKTYQIIENRAIGYGNDEDEFYKSHRHSLMFAGDGQILTNPTDIFKWHQGFKNATIGTSGLWKKMHTKAKLNNGTSINFGLGVEFETHNGYQAMGFDGMIISGFVSKYLYFPELDIAFFTTQNTFDWDFKERFFKLVDLYVPKKSIHNKRNKFKEVKLSNNELKKYEGDYLFYYNDDDRKANSVRLKNDQLLVLSLDGDEIAKLIPIGGHKFLFGEEASAILEFKIDGNFKQYFYDDLQNKKPWLFKEYNPHEHSEKELREYEGSYFNNDFQISKRLKFENGKLYYYYRNGAWKEEMLSLSKDLLEIPISPIEFVRNEKNQIIGFDLMGVFFQRQ